MAEYNTLGNLASAFNKWKTDNDIKIKPADAFGYFWVLHPEAKARWRVEFEEKVEDATAEEIENFHNMFEEGGNLFGISMSKPTEYRGIKLFKTTEYNDSFSIPDVLYSYDGQIINKGTTVIVDGKETELQAVIKPQTIIFSNGFDGRDDFLSHDTGIIYGFGYQTKQRNNNRQGDNSLIGIIEYKTGNLHLLRSSLKNEQLTLDYEDFCVNVLPTLDIGSGGEGGSDSGGSADMGSASEDSKTLNGHTNEDSSDSGDSEVPTFDPLERMNVSGTLTYFGNPCKEVFSFPLEKEG